MRPIFKLIAALIVCSALAWGWPQLSLTDYTSPSLVTPALIAAGPDGALWFTDASRGIGRITTTGAITLYPVPTQSSQPWGIVAGPDGALWFTEFSANQIGRSTTAGVVTEYPIPTANSGPRLITVGPDGALWFTEETANKIGRIDTSGVVTEYAIPTASSSPDGIVTGPDGALWFAEYNGNKIGRVTIAGAFTEYAPPTASSGPINITTGPDGALWFTENTAYKIARVTTDGSFTEYPLPASSSIGLSGITIGSDGALWFTEFSKIGRITTAGLLTEYPLASTLLLGIASGPDGALWFTKEQARKITRGVIVPVVGASIFPIELPPGDVGTPYSASLSAADGAPPYSNWTVSSGPLPPGLALNPATGVISGTPTDPGNNPNNPYFNFNVTVQDSSGATSLAQTFTISINPILQIVGPTSLPVGIVGVGYPPPFTLGGIGFSSSGGTVTLGPGHPDSFPTWSAVGLPNGLSMSAAGLLGGTPAAGSQGTYQPQFTVKDLVNGTATISLPLTIGVTEVPPLQITTPHTLPTGKQGTNYFQTFTASGGFPSYAWDVVAGALPAGEFLGGDGSLIGTPTAFGTFTFTLRVTDFLSFTATQTFTLTIASAVTIQSTSVPSGAVAIPYQQILTASGCTAPYTWSLISGSLPTGLSLASNGTISGTGVSTGTSTFTVRVTDAASLTSTQTLSMEMIPQLAITTTTLPSGKVGVPYSAPLTAIGGYYPYTWTLISGTLPAGLTLFGADGVISGTPLTAGTTSFTLRATDGASPPAAQALTLTITGGALTITTTNLPAGIVGNSYTQYLAGSGGKPPYSWSLASGSLPPGLSLSNNGTDGAGAVIMGTLTTVGNFNFTVRLADSAATFATQPYALPVETQLNINADSSLPFARQGTFYSQTLTATGGTPPYSWSMSPAASAGLSLSTAGVISGMPTTAGDQFLLVTVTDANAISSVRSFTLTINPPCSYTINPAGQVFPAAGGSGQIVVPAGFGCTWTVSGAPPWVTVTNPGSGSGFGVVNYVVAPNTTNNALNTTLTVAGFSYAIQAQGASLPPFIGSMPHLAAEENWTTAFTLVNKSASAATARLSLFGDPTGLLSLPLVFPQQPSAPGPVMAASLDQTLSANASLVIGTGGLQVPPVLVGSARLYAAGAVDGFAIFHLIPGAQEAVVSLETRNAGSYLLPFDNTNNVVLSVAVANLAAQTANIAVIIRDETGTQIQAPGASIAIAANGHQAFVLPTLFPTTANQRGTIEFDTPAGGRISVLGIRTTPLASTNSKTLTTVPALADVGTGGGSFAFLASGGDGWQTTFVLVNTGASAASATLSFLDPSGNPLALPLSGSGASTLASSVTPTLAPGASYIVQTAGAPTLLTGSAQLTTPGNISGFAIFRFNPTGQEAVVPLESRNAPSYLLAFDDTGNTATGIAVNTVSASSQPVTIPVVVRDDAGNMLAQHNLLVPANGDFSGNLAQFSATLGAILFPETANIRGTLEFDAPLGVQIGVIGIRTPPANTYTTLPALAK